GDVDLLPRLADDLADEALAVAVAIGQGGVDEVEPELDGALEGADGLVVGPAEPLLAADSPCAVADLGNLPAGAAELAVVHDWPLKEGSKESGVRRPLRGRSRPS